MTSTGHLHLDGDPVPQAHDKTQLFTPFLSTNLLLLSPLPISFNRPSILPTPRSRTLKSSSTPPSLSQTRSSQPVLLTLSETSPTNTASTLVRSHLLPLNYCNSHLTCLPAFRAGFVKHRLSHSCLLKKKKKSNGFPSLCSQMSTRHQEETFEALQDAVAAHISRLIYLPPPHTPSFLRASELCPLDLCAFITLFL